MKKTLFWILSALAMLIAFILLYLKYGGIPHYSVETIPYVARTTPARSERGREGQASIPSRRMNSTT